MNQQMTTAEKIRFLCEEAMKRPEEVTRTEVRDNTGIRIGAVQLDSRLGYEDMDESPVVVIGNRTGR